MGPRARPALLLLILLRTVATQGRSPRESGGCGPERGAAGGGGEEKSKLAFLSDWEFAKLGTTAQPCARSPPPTFPGGDVSHWGADGVTGPLAPRPSPPPPARSLSLLLWSHARNHPLPPPTVPCLDINLFSSRPSSDYGSLDSDLGILVSTGGCVGLPPIIPKQEVLFTKGDLGRSAPSVFPSSGALRVGRLWDERTHGGPSRVSISEPLALWVGGS